MAHEEAPDPRRPLDTFINEKTGSLATYQYEVSVGHGSTCSQCGGIHIKYTGDGLVKADSVC